MAGARTDHLSYPIQRLQCDSCSSSEQAELSNHTSDIINNQCRYQHIYRNDSDSSDHAVERGFNCSSSLAVNNLTTSATGINRSNDNRK
ncbi:hypothetical protein GJ496_002332 [Pomphorhynchus laevis]|nr:hypothetical protein GJ496_002332 [Pomphorhynchus laevis]